MATLTDELLKEAVHHHPTTTQIGILERLFTLWFKGFVYNQIWEDPRVDATALELDHESRILTISSGGCNVLNYLIHKPKKIVALDLNEAHLSLTRLKLAALRTLPNHEEFFQFFGVAKGHHNIQTYQQHMRHQLDNNTRTFWDSRGVTGQKRIQYFQKGLYDQTKLGLFLRSLHGLSKIAGGNPKRLLQAQTIAEQELFFEAEVIPFFDQKFVKWLSKRAVTVFGLGIPPSQHQVLHDESNGQIVTLFQDRLHKLVCGFPLHDNYFAWQAFGRCYDTQNRQAIPDYLRASHYDTLRENAHRVETHVTSLTAYLKTQPNNTFNKFVLLDAQDWMPPATIAELWREIMRVGQPGSHIIFRTAGTQSPIETTLPNDLRSKLAYCLEKSQHLHTQDRSAIYGMFHLYIKTGKA
jgi:S-adenosylmethionine-diacylglycerol 3-amino-3-carboxypropyl transferase